MVALSNDSTWVVESTGIDLYSGLAGIGLGFAYAGKLLQQTCYSEVARDCLNTMLWKMAYQPADDQQVVGGFSGLGATVYALAQFHHLLSDTRLVEPLEKTIRGIIKAAKMVSEKFLPSAKPLLKAFFSMLP